MSEKLKEEIEILTEQAHSYASTYLDLLKVKATKIIVNAGASLANILVISILSSFGLLFLGIALAKYLNQILESQFVGFLIVGFLFFLMIVIFILMSKKLVFNIVRRNIIKNIHHEN
ncbi:MAG: hypothetical protein U0V72_03105 [Cytophagales bacterium]